MLQFELSESIGGSSSLLHLSTGEKPLTMLAPRCKGQLDCYIFYAIIALNYEYYTSAKHLYSYSTVTHCGLTIILKVQNRPAINLE